MKAWFRLSSQWRSGGWGGGGLGEEGGAPVRVHWSREHGVRGWSGDLPLSHWVRPGSVESRHPDYPAIPPRGLPVPGKRIWGSSPVIFRNIFIMDISLQFIYNWNLFLPSLRIISKFKILFLFWCRQHFLEFWSVPPVGACERSYSLPVKLFCYEPSLRHEWQSGG